MAITTFNTNIAAFGAQRNIKLSSAAVQSSLSKLSSGLRVPTAKDDAAALAIGANIRAEVAGLKQASVNAGQATSMLQIAEGAMSQVGEILVRMKSLAVQASSGQLSNVDRATLDAEFQALKAEIDRISSDAEFNGTKLVSATTRTIADRIETGANITNLIGQGFESISFVDGYGDGALHIAYDATNDIMTATNLVSGATQSVSIGDTAIAAGALQTVNFNSLGATVVLNSNFNKTVDIAATNTAAVTGTGVIEAGSIRLMSVAVDSTDPTDATVFDFGALNTAAIAFDATTATDTIFTLAGFYKDGSAASLTMAPAAGVNMSTLGTKTATLSDANGNSITIQFNVTTAFVNADVGTVTAAELGQVVGSNSVVATSTAFDFKIGTGVVAAEDTLSFSIGAVSAGVLGVGGSDIMTADNADLAIGAVNAAISTLSGTRAAVGAVQSRLDFASNNLAVSIENSEAARSALLDVDVAEEITNFTTKQVLLQAGVSMLAQANQLPQNLLELLR